MGRDHGDRPKKAPKRKVARGAVPSGRTRSRAARRRLVVAADVGGTKTLIGLFDVAGARPRLVRKTRFSSRELRSFQQGLRAFLDEDRRAPKIAGVAVGVAGPVAEGRSLEVNLPWAVDRRRIARVAGIPAVQVLNDVEATAWGVGVLTSRKLHSLTPGLRARSTGSAAMIAAGTGLGTAAMVWDGSRRVPAAAEGGHVGWAPRDDVDLELWRFLKQRHGRVSVERVVSGDGLGAIFDFLVSSGREKPGAKFLESLDRSADRNAAIAASALAWSAAGELGKPVSGLGFGTRASSGRRSSGDRPGGSRKTRAARGSLGDAGEAAIPDRAASRALDRFVRSYGAAAGDLALTVGARGGVFVGGGIAPRILPRLAAGGFVAGFRDKGRMAPYVESVPVHVILEPETALWGAAECAARLS